MNVYVLFNAVTGLNITGDNEAVFLAQRCRRDRKLWASRGVSLKHCLFVCAQLEALEKRNEDHVQRRGKKSFSPARRQTPPLLPQEDD